MPLIEFKTSLKSLKFGKDRPYEGSSNQPYIQSSIPEGDIPTSGGPDFILRGGILAPISAAKDVSRLTQMFFDLKSPNGSLFIAKQNVLSRTSVQTEASTGAGYGGNFVNQGVYLPSSTIAQAGVGFTGTHLNLFGIDPSSPMAGVTQTSLSSLFFNKSDSKPILTLGLNRYEDIVKKANNKDFNPPKDKKDFQKEGFRLSPTDIGPNLSIISSKNQPSKYSNRLLKFWDKKQVVENIDDNIQTYPGGPGSILGVGDTYIKFADQRTGVNNLKLDKDFFTKGYSIFKRQTTVILSNPDQNSISSNINYINAVPSGSAKGASSTYEFLTRNPVGNDIEYTSPLAPSGQRTNTNDFSVYQPGTLTPGPLATDFKKYQTLKTHTINYTGSVPSSSIKGASSTYESLTGKPVGNLITYGNNERRNTNDFNVYKRGTFEPSTLATEQPGINLQFKDYSIYAYNQTQLNESTSSKAAFKEDFRKKLILSQSTSNAILSISPSYTLFNYANRTNAGDPGYLNGLVGNGGKNVLNYAVASGKGIDEDYKIALDKITAGAIYSETVAKHDPYDDGGSTKHAGNDLVKFSIGVVKNDTTGNSNYMHFRAFIDSFSDSYTSDWNSYNYVGRGDKFYNYEGFERTINLSFTVFAQSKAELIPMYKKLNYLASSLAPDYSNSGFMKGNLHKLTIGGYLFDQVGIIKSITYNVPEETPWEIGINEVGGEDTSVKELPHMIKVTGLTFVPIQHFLPRVADPYPIKDDSYSTRYIALAADTKDNDTNYTKYQTT
jgi:hypothetical protein